MHVWRSIHHLISVYLAWLLQSFARSEARTPVFYHCLSEPELGYRAQHHPNYIAVIPFEQVSVCQNYYLPRHAEFARLKDAHTPGTRLILNRMAWSAEKKSTKAKVNFLASTSH